MFQRNRLKCEKLTDDGRQVIAKAHIALARWAKKKLLHQGYCIHKLLKTLWLLP